MPSMQLPSIINRLEACEAMAAMVNGSPSMVHLIWTFENCNRYRPLNAKIRLKT